MEWWIWLILAFVVASALWGAISPQSRVFSSWLYRNPEANEPSDAAYLLTRATCVGVLIVIVVAVVNLTALAS